MLLKEIDRAATVAWSPHAFQSSSYLMLGTVAGALDASFSTNSELELFSVDWGDDSLAAINEDGRQGEDTSSRTDDIFSHDANTSTDFDNIGKGHKLTRRGHTQSQGRFHRLAWTEFRLEQYSMGLVACGLENGALELWDPTKLSAKTPLLRNELHHGALRGLEFNHLQNNLLVSAATDAEIFIWDLNNLQKPYTPGAKSNKLGDVSFAAWNRIVPHILATSSTNGNTVIWDLKNKREVITLAEGRAPCTAIAWNPDVPTQLITAIDSDTNPILLKWDLRNAHAPEKILKGHSKGILSVSWCPKDSELLLSAGKDNRTLCWNPKSGEVIGELASSSNWIFDVQWCPHNPALLSTASFDSKVYIYSLPASNRSIEKDNVVVQQDPFNIGSSPLSNVFTLKKAPKWLQRKIGAVFAFGGRIVTFSSTKEGGPKMIRIQNFVSDAEFSKRASDLEESLHLNDLAGFCDRRIAQFEKNSKEREYWSFLKIFFLADNRRHILEFLGFENENRKPLVIDPSKTIFKAVDSQNVPSFIASSNEGHVSLTSHDSDSHMYQPVSSNQNYGVAFTTSPSMNSSKASHGTDYDAIDKNEIFDSAIPSNNHEPSAHDFFRNVERKETIGVPIYTSDESDLDKLIMRTIIIGDFENAVKLCTEANRMADALVLATCGGEELLTRTQEAYFRKCKSSFSRLLSAIIKYDLQAIVDTTNISDWKEIFAIICSSAKFEDFNFLCESLGRRLETEANDFKSAVFCYLCSNNYVRVCSIWAEECSADRLDQENLIAKTMVFRKAVENNVGRDLAESEFTLNFMSDFYCSHAETLCSHGMLFPAAKYLSLVTNDDIISSEFFRKLSDRIFNCLRGKSVLLPKPCCSFENVDVFSTKVDTSIPTQHSTVFSSPVHPPTLYSSSAFPTAGPSNTSHIASYNSMDYASQYRTNSNQAMPSHLVQNGHLYPSSYSQGGYLPTLGADTLNAPTEFSSQPKYAVASMSVPTFHDMPPSIPSFDRVTPTSTIHGGPMTAYHDPPYIAPKRKPSETQHKPVPIMAPLPNSNSFSQTPAPYNPSFTAQSYQQYPMASNLAPRQGPTAVSAMNQIVTATAALPLPSASVSDVSHSPPTQPVKKLLPAGDRSQISPAQRPVMDILLSSLQKCKQLQLMPQQKKIVEDCEKRINFFLDRLNNKEVSEEVIAKMLDLVAALQNRQFENAYNIHIALITSKFDEVGQWMVGIKRLIEMLRSIQPLPAGS